MGEMKPIGQNSALVQIKFLTPMEIAQQFFQLLGINDDFRPVFYQEKPDDLK